jgi:hypothetical protein
MKEDMNQMKVWAIFYSERRVTVHIKLRDGTFYNGLITQLSLNKSDNDFLVINDRVLGETEVYFLEIDKLERFRGDSK